MASVIEPGTVERVLPTPTDIDRDYWCGGADGMLHVQYCETCARWTHPPVAACPSCAAPPTFRPVSGAGTVFSYTVNHHRYRPDVPVPYVIALVELAEQADLRVATDIVDCEPEAVQIGMAVRVRFEQYGEIFVPVFAPEHQDPAAARAVS